MLSEFLGHFYCKETMNNMEFVTLRTKEFVDSIYVSNDNTELTFMRTPAPVLKNINYLSP